MVDVTIKNIPSGITEEQIVEWVSILVERKYNAEIQKIPALVEAQETAKTEIDSFRIANKLKTKYVVKEIVIEEPIVKE